MSKPRQDANEWTLRLLEFLEDGEWRDYQEVLVEVSKVVPPGIAFRRAEYYREYHFTRAGTPVTERKHGDRNDTIKTGQRFIVGKSIADLRRSGRLEIEYHENSTSTRKKPKLVRRVK